MVRRDARFRTRLGRRMALGGHGRIAAAALAVAGALAGPSVARAQGPAVDQSDSDVAWLAMRSEYLLVWTEDRGGGPRIMAKRVRANGLPVSGAAHGSWEATRHASGAALGEQGWPAVIDGLLVYSERAPGADNFDLFAQRLFDNGRPIGLPWRVLEAPGDQRMPDVLAVPRDRGEDYLIVWSDDSRDQGDLWGLRVDYAFRRSRGGPFVVAEGPGSAEDPALVRDPLEPSELLVFFSDDRSGNRDIYGARLLDTGLPRGGPSAAPFPVTTSPEEDSAPGAAAGLEGVGPRARANHLLVFTRESLTDGPDIMGLRLERTGLPRGVPFPLAGGRGLQAGPALALEAGPAPRREPAELLLTWTDDVLGNLDVLGQTVSVTGQAVSHVRWLVAD